MQLTNDTFTGNSSTASAAGESGYGGPIEIDSGATTIANSTFTGNSANSNATGAGHAGAVADYQSVTITGTSFTENTATNSEAARSSKKAAERSSVATPSQATRPPGLAPTATGLGGADYCQRREPQCDQLHHQPQPRPRSAVEAFYATAADHRCSNSTISGNTANLGGVSSDAANIQANSVAIVDNTTVGTGDAGGAVYETNNSRQPG